MKKYSLVGEIADFDYHDGMWDFCGPKSLKAFLAELKAGERAEIEINSPGGLVMSGVEMANAIKNSDAHIIAHVTGIAASMASVIVCACDEIQMEEASFMMMHDPWASLSGNAEQLRKEAAFLDQCKAVCISFYRNKFSCGEERLAELMGEETWYTGAECAEAGLDCTVVKSGTKAAAKIGSRQFAKMPDAAKALYSFRQMDKDTVAAVEAVRAEQSADGEPPADPPKAAAAENWEARYKGASKKINELQGAVDAQASTISDLNKRLDCAMKDLAEAQAKASELAGAVERQKADLDAKDRDLAEARNSLAEASKQVEHLKETRSLLTGGVLGMPEDSAKMDISAGRTPEERENIRRNIRAKKNSKN